MGRCKVRGRERGDEKGLKAADSGITLLMEQEPTLRGAATSSDDMSAAAPGQPTLEELCAAARRDVLARLGLLSQQPSSASMSTPRAHTPILEPADRFAKAVAKTDGVLPTSEGRGQLHHPAVRQRRSEVDNPPPVEELCAAARRDVLARLGFVGRVPPPPPSNSQMQISSSDGTEWSYGESLASR